MKDTSKIKKMGRRKIRRIKVITKMLEKRQMYTRELKKTGERNEFRKVHNLFSKT